MKLRRPGYLLIYLLSTRPKAWACATVSGVYCVLVSVIQQSAFCTWSVFLAVLLVLPIDSASMRHGEPRHFDADQASQVLVYSSVHDRMGSTTCDQ